MSCRGIRGGAEWNGDLGLYALVWGVPGLGQGGRVLGVGRCHVWKFACADEVRERSTWQNRKVSSLKVAVSCFWVGYRCNPKQTGPRAREKVM